MRTKRILMLTLCAVGIPALIAGAVLWGNPAKTPPYSLRITEIMSNNASAWPDKEGDFHDWAEITNTGTTPLELRDFSLTDDATEPQAFVFEKQTLAAGESTLVYLTGKAGEDRAGYAPFALANGDTLMLYYQDTLIHSLSVGDAPANVSYGLYNDEAVWFASPTPQKANGGLCATTLEALRTVCSTGVRIHEVCAVSRDGDALYPTDWVEIKNTTDRPLSLGGYRLTERLTETGFTFPDVTLQAGGYLLVSCDEQGTDAWCAPFSLSPYGETLSLITPDGVVCDTFESGKLRYGVSSGRAENGSLDRVYFTTPTPNAANGHGVSGYAAVPTAQAGGYGKNSVTVAISVPAECRVYYTTDGSIPTESDTRYTAPFTVNKTTVVRAVAYRDGALHSDVMTETYLLTEPHDIPILSVSGEPTALFGASGAFTDFMNEEKEAAVHAEYFEADGGKATAFDSLLRISGGLSRYNVQKAFSLNLNQTVGQTSVSYPFFKDGTTEEFGNLLLRPSGSDWNSAKLRDEFVAAALEGDRDFVIQGVRPVALYINGAYHGLYYLREKRNESFVAAETGIPEERVEIAKSPAIYESHLPMHPDMKDLVHYAQTHDLSQDEHYRYVTERINEQSLMRYYAVQTWFGNGDVINNTAYYRDSDGGEWNWIVFDMDWACTSFYEKHTFLQQLYDGSGPHTYRNYHDPLMTALLKNKNFRTDFLKIYKELMQTTLDSERLIPILDTLAAEIKTEIPRQHARYGAPSVTTWEKQITYMRGFIRGRNATITRQLCDVFGLSEEDWNEL